AVVAVLEPLLPAFRERLRLRHEELRRFAADALLTLVERLRGLRIRRREVAEVARDRLIDGGFTDALEAIGDPGAVLGADRVGARPALEIRALGRPAERASPDFLREVAAAELVRPAALLVDRLPKRGDGL